MMRTKPFFFDEIQKDSARQWDILDANPELAWPWRLLFQQVQDPRHVLSELLQNADDAGATWAGVQVTDKAFIFSHNGEDFDRSAFQSICRFGLSQKRFLHTIGFRGLGFKSIFSLGPRVEVQTPSLAFAFEKTRFTRPEWLDEAMANGRTTIRVEFDSENKRNWLVSQIQKEWIRNPLSLLFFHSIQTVDLLDTCLTRRSLGSGPVPRSEWIEVGSTTPTRLLRIASPAESFPTECQQEIREQRGLSEEDFNLPDCEVELIFGEIENQRLYVVLPTEVSLELPFSVNAPFIQDPARTGIKDPVTSPTNHWLLERAGQLAASSMCAWLSNKNLSIAHRVQAYDLLPAAPRVNGRSLAVDTANLILNSLKFRLEGNNVLIDPSGRLVEKTECFDLPSSLVDTWPLQNILKIFGEEGQQFILAPEVTGPARDRLASWKRLKRLEHREILDKLAKAEKPPHLERGGLDNLWAYVQQHLDGWKNVWDNQKERSLPICPAEDVEWLLPVREVVVISPKEKKFTEDEKTLLKQFIHFIDEGWLKHIRQERPEALALAGPERTQLHALVFELAQALNLDSGVVPETVIRQAAVEPTFNLRMISQFKNVRSQAEIFLFAWMAARFDVDLPESFQYICADKQLRPASEGLFANIADELEGLLHPTWFLQHSLHPDYEDKVKEPYTQSWLPWVNSYKSKIRRFLMPDKISESLVSKSDCVDFCHQRGGAAPTDYPLASSSYFTEDYDFSESNWKHWTEQAKSDSKIWSRLLQLICDDWKNGWKERSGCHIFQEGRIYSRPLRHGHLIAQWIYRLRNIRCLPDKHGKFHLPSELFRLTSQTEVLLSYKLEPFIPERLDKPEYYELLDLLGVNTRPHSAEKLLERLRAFAHAGKPPLEQLTNLYQVFDRVMPGLYQTEKDLVKQAFTDGKLVYSQDGDFLPVADIFQRNDHGFPGIALIHASLAGLGLWDLVGVAKNPTPEFILQWVKSLPSGQKLGEVDQGRLREVLQAFPQMVWENCIHWLNLEGEWQPVQQLEWMVAEELSMDLFVRFRQKTADFRMISKDNYLFLVRAGLLSISSQVERRLENPTVVDGLAVQPAWIRVLARRIFCVERVGWTVTQYEAVRTQAARLGLTQLVYVRSLLITPYLNNEPVAPAYSAHVAWNQDDLVIYQVTGTKRRYRDMTEEICAHVDDSEIRRAIMECAERDETFINEYFDDTFGLEDKGLVDQFGQMNREELETIGEVVHTASHSSHVKTVRGTNTSTTLPGPVEELPPEEVMRYFQGKGYKWQAKERRFFNPANFQFVLKVALPFAWVEKSEHGGGLAAYRFVDGSLAAGVKLRSDAWNMLAQHPVNYYLVLEERDNGFLELNNQRIQEMAQNKQLGIYPEAYLLRKV